jgi:hypothetical protein
MGATFRQRNPSATKNILHAILDAGKFEVAVGFPRGKAQAYPDGTSVINIAAAHVYGVGVPERDFMAFAKKDIAHVTKSIMEKVAKSTVEIDPDKAMKLREAAGIAAADAIRASIIKLDDPPNSPATIAKKGSSNPLVDTGHMKDSVTHIVRKRTRA